MLFKIGSQLFIDQAVHQRTDIGIAKLRLGLAFKLRIGQLDGDNGGDTFTAVFAADLVVALDDAGFDTVVIQYTGQRCFEACVFLGGSACQQDSGYFY